MQNLVESGETVGTSLNQFDNRVIEGSCDGKIGHVDLYTDYCSNDEPVAAVSQTGNQTAICLIFYERTSGGVRHKTVPSIS
jgi:hypothetical protein